LLRLLCLRASSVFCVLCAWNMFLRCKCRLSYLIRFASHPGSASEAALVPYLQPCLSLPACQPFLQSSHSANFHCALRSSLVSFSSSPFCCFANKLHCHTVFACDVLGL
jgi:hypothetical protein